MRAKSLTGVAAWTAVSTALKLAASLLVMKLLAVSYGPVGVGLAGNLLTFVTVLTTFAGGGIYNGVTKYVAALPEDGRRRVLGTSATVVLGCSLLVGVALLVLADPIGRLLFGRDGFAGPVRALAVVQFGLAYASLYQSILKGRRDATGTALSVIGGSVLGASAYWICGVLGGYTGALIGLGLLPALAVVPSYLVLRRRDRDSLRMLRPSWDTETARRLGKFAIMVAVTAALLPSVHIFLRHLLADAHGLGEAGIWQGMSKISDSYLQLLTAPLSLYLLPSLSRLSHAGEISREVGRALRFVLVAAGVVALGLWLTRDLVIEMLYSGEFTAMRELFAWQLCGDVLKVGAYVFGYFVLARASLRFYVLAEVSQFVLLCTISLILIPAHGAVGATQAYLVTYVVHFTLCCAVFLLWRRKARR
ncbi:antigen flippase [Amycolatopsis sulphurea]|uniref:Antigen flippase n=1 Tax=Amycolatopsis sulphurea TaxID=76022 RepID=A0A2A9FET0_9PSEU|nr:lipid III flippase WzxE [Amycolatopsis sulphurea]PFG49251.1 antigen flippase [Amycolatopsis sulphurea]